MKQFGTPLFLKGPPFSTNPPTSEQFFYDPPLCPNFKNKNPPNFMGEETMMPHAISSFDRRRVFTLNAHTYRKQCVNFY